MTSSRPRRCKRCGEIYISCPHYATWGDGIDTNHAERIKARYALGKRFNSEDHDTADYFTDVAQ